MNLGEIVANVNARVLPATNIDTLIKRWANRGQQKFLSEANHQFNWLTQTEYTLVTQPNQKEYGLSPLVDVGKVIIFTERTSPRRIEFVTRSDLLERVPDLDNHVGTPEIAYLSGFTPVQNQPTSTSTLDLVSSSASDTTVVVKIDGLDSLNTLIGEEVTLTGTTPVTTVNSYSKILGRGLSAYPVGIITITSNGGLITNAKISPRDRQGMYPKVVLYPTPQGSETIYYDFTMKLPALVNNNDFSLIPEQYHDAIEDYCAYYGHLHKNDPVAAQGAMASFKDTVMRAVMDDKGPKRKTIMKSWFPNQFLSEGRLPGNYPRNY